MTTRHTSAEAAPTRWGRFGRTLSVVCGLLAVVASSAMTALTIVQMVFDVSTHLGNTAIPLSLALELPLPAAADAGSAVVDHGAVSQATLTAGGFSGTVIEFLLTGVILSRVADILILAAIAIVGIILLRGGLLSRRATLLAASGSVGYVVLSTIGVVIYSFGRWAASTELVDNPGEPAPYQMLFQSPSPLPGGWVVVALVLIIVLGRRAQRDLETVV